VKDFPENFRPYQDILKDRSMLVIKTDPFPIECVVRGYLSGSGWQEYQETGEVCGLPLPKGLVESSKLPEPIFTPATKAEIGHHDENIPFGEVERILGEDLAGELKHLALTIYQEAAEFAEQRGDHHRRYQDGVWNQGRETLPHRRTSDPGFFAILAKR
jgi:phosphoribosylaminoimidazole-succinocarboxamide synthase